MHRARLGLVIASIVVGAGVTAALAAASAARTATVDAATATAGTRVVIFDAFTSSGAPAIRVTSTVHGTCNGGSAAIDRNDAWRCFAGNFVYDPCFSSRAARGIVLCPAGAWSGTGVEIKLTGKLTGANRRAPSTAGAPWALKTTSGLKCLLATGATSFLDHQRANYFCLKSKDVLWGSPSRKSEPWTIFAAPTTATRLTRRDKIAVAWF